MQVKMISLVTEVNSEKIVNSTGEEWNAKGMSPFLQPSIQLTPAALTAQIDPVMAKKVLECRH